MLLRLSGQEGRVKQQHFGFWNTVAVWKAESRYSIVGTVQKTDAESMVNAAEEFLKVL